MSQSTQTHPDGAAIAPIPTRYAGCHFRSRLEARWAVTFDHLGIEWEYEPQGFMVTDRLNFVVNTGDPEPDPWPYLPDFWLPGLGLWAEVKGKLDGGDAMEFLTETASLSSQTGSDVLLLGPIPKPVRRSAWPLKFHMAETLLVYRGWALGMWDQPAMEWPIPIASDHGDLDLERLDSLTDGWAEQLDPRMIDAYTAGRSARFEHGESGA